MTSTPVYESNIEIIFADWLDALRRGDLETMAGRLARDVVHQGSSPTGSAATAKTHRDEALEAVGASATWVTPQEIGVAPSTRSRTFACQPPTGGRHGV